MSVICPRCRVENRDQAKRCMACNEDLSRRQPEPSGRLCPSGRHPMDPSWKACPYCDAERKAKDVVPATPVSPPEPSVPRSQNRDPVREIPRPPLAAPAPPARPPEAVVLQSRPRRQTAFVGPDNDAAVMPSAEAPSQPAASVSAAPTRRRTAFAAAPPAETARETPPSAPVPRQPSSTSAAGTVATGRRIVGILVTYTWLPEGQVFPVREGRNFLGCDPECDIALSTDSHLSGRHATVVYRGQDFWIDDEKSMNGTFVDGESVEEKQRLPNYATVRTGSTCWTFVALDRSGQA